MEWLWRNDASFISVERAGLDGFRNQYVRETSLWQVNLSSIVSDDANFVLETRGPNVSGIKYFWQFYHENIWKLGLETAFTTKRA